MIERGKRLKHLNNFLREYAKNTKQSLQKAVILYIQNHRLNEAESLELIEDIKNVPPK